MVTLCGGIGMNSDKKRIRNLRILVGVLIAFIVVDLFASLSFYNDCQNDQKLIEKMALDINALIVDNERLSKALQKYEVDKKYLQGIGATEDQATKIIKASKAHNIDPK